MQESVPGRRPARAATLATMILAPAFAVLAWCAAEGPATEWRELPREGRTPLRYAVVLPPGFARERPVPVVLALPPGKQDQAMVERALALYFAEGAARGFAVVCPAADGDRPFFADGLDDLGPLLDRIRTEFAVEGGRVHVAGPSNGGRAAFRVAARWPERCASLTAFPGFADEADAAALANLYDLPVALFCGGDDGGWLERAEANRARLAAAGLTRVSLRTFPGEGHAPPSFTGELLFQTLAEVRALAAERAAAERAISAMLDDFHAAAAAADGARYFGHFAPDAVFLGTDATERWTRAEFEAFAKPYFDRGKGWSYTPRDRHVALAAGLDTAWFDERLDNAKYGECRGSGAVVRIGETWRLAQYNLTIPVPNDLAEEFVARIRAAADDR